jgi:hypothetical protein
MRGYVLELSCYLMINQLSLEFTDSRQEVLKDPLLACMVPLKNCSNQK